jgi:ABC-type phosphate transport system auxiliary subunit
MIKRLKAETEKLQWLLDRQEKAIYNFHDNKCKKSLKPSAAVLNGLQQDIARQEILIKDIKEKITESSQKIEDVIMQAL